MKELFTLTSSLLTIFERFLILAFCTATVLYLYCVIRCHTAKKEKTPLKIIIRRALIESSLICIVFLSIYFAVFVKYTGWQRFVWDEWYWSFSRNTYLMLLPEILILVFVSIFFFIQTNKLSNLLKN
jgi:hypothetical protein